MMEGSGLQSAQGGWETGAGYAELCVTTNFTFLKGASHPEELVVRAAELGLEAIAITDHNSLAGVVRAYSALEELKREIREKGSGDIEGKISALPRLIAGARLILQDSAVNWLALPTSRRAYANLSRMLSIGKRRAQKGACHLFQKDLLAWGEGLILIAFEGEDGQGVGGRGKNAGQDISELQDISRAFSSHVFLGVAPRYDGGDRERFHRHAAMAGRCGLSLVALGDVLMHRGNRRRLADVLTCLREGLKIDEIGTRALPNGERRLKGAADMVRMFGDHPEAVGRTLEIARRCTFSLDELSYEYPDETSGGETPQDRLVRLVEGGLKRRFPGGVSRGTRDKVDKELALIARLGFAAYFLSVHDIVEFARSRNILCQGRGSAANSIICYALGITEVGPDRISMVFERFISEARGEPPDIDVDFEHERREEVIQYIYRKYGRHRAGICATVIHFRGRSSIGEVGKVMGLSQDVLGALTGRMWGSSGQRPDRAELQKMGLNPDDRRLMQALDLMGQIHGFPRHLSQHVGGFVITRRRLDELCPIENAAMQDRTIIEWDKDDIDALGILKIDVLSLGMLTCIRKSFDLIARHGGPRLCLATLPEEDQQTYDMLCVADAIGVFQVESRAQLNFLPRMKPRTFYDLVIEVAIIRPGPIQGDMVHPYIRRRRGEEKVEFPSEELRSVLGKTLGVPLFQEQAMQIAIVAAGFSAEEADRLRRSLATFRRMGTISTFRDKFISGMRARGYTPEFSTRCFSQIEGFGEYGFPESHAASFALLAYASAWLKRHHPAAFTCALLNSQPMGFYAPAQLIRDAREHGVEVRPVCINASEWDNRLELDGAGALAIRLGFRQVKGMSVEDAEWIVRARGNGYGDPESVWRRAGVGPRVLERLARADGFSVLGLTRREALWQVRAIGGNRPLPLFSCSGTDALAGENIREDIPDLPVMSRGQEMVEDYRITRFSLRAHPMELLRGELGSLVPHGRLVEIPLGFVSVCGLVITRQRPGTASGVIFITLEDETGVCNVIVWPKTYEKFRAQVIGGRLLRVHGKLQREGVVVHLVARKIEDLSDRLEGLGLDEEELAVPGATDNQRFSGRITRAARHPREQARKLFPSRDFH